MLKAEHLDQFADELAGHFSVAAVLDALHAFVHPTVNVFAAFRLAIYRGETERFVERKNVFFHSTVRPTFRDEFWPLARKHGMSPMALLAFQRRELLTWSEGMRILESRGDESWLFDLRAGTRCSTVPIARAVLGWLRIGRRMFCARAIS